MGSCLHRDLRPNNRSDSYSDVCRRHLASLEFTQSFRISRSRSLGLFVMLAVASFVLTFVFYLASCIDMRSERASHCHHYDHSLLMHINRAQVSFTSPPPHRRPFVQPWRRFRRNLFLLPFATLSSTPHSPTDIAICCLPAFFSVRGYSTYDAYTTGSC